PQYRSIRGHHSRLSLLPLGTIHNVIPALRRLSSFRPAPSFRPTMRVVAVGTASQFETQLSLDQPRLHEFRKVRQCPQEYIRSLMKDPLDRVGPVHQRIETAPGREVVLPDLACLLSHFRSVFLPLLQEPRKPGYCVFRDAQTEFGPLRPVGQLKPVGDYDWHRARFHCLEEAYRRRRYPPRTENKLAT